MHDLIFSKLFECILILDKRKLLNRFYHQTYLERKNTVFKNLNIADKPTTLTEAWFDS